MKKLILVAALLATQVIAQPLTLLTLSGVGSQSDTSARYFAPLIERELGRPVVVINVPGANGWIGYEQFIGSAANGNTVLVGNTSLAWLAADNGVDSMERVKPVYGLTYSQMLVIVPGNSTINKISDLVKSPRKLNGGSSAVMTGVSMNLMDKHLGTNTEVVTYRQAPQMVVDLIAGRLDYTVSSSGNASTQSFIESGKLKVIGVLGATRSLEHPTVPTLKEQGYTTIEDFAWCAFFTHTNIPFDKFQEIQSAIKNAMNTPEARAFEKRPGRPSLYNSNGLVVRQLLVKEFNIIKENK